MIRALSIVPGWLYALIVAGLIAANLIASTRLSAERLAHQTTKTAYAEQRAAAEKTRADEEAKRRQTEQELINAQATHAAKIEALQLDTDRARAAAVTAANGLRSAAATAAQRAQCSDPTSPGLRETDDPIGVLAHVLGRIDDRATELAEAADQRHIAGRACEREYDAAREALMR